MERLAGRTVMGLMGVKSRVNFSFLCVCIYILFCFWKSFVWASIHKIWNKNFSIPSNSKALFHFGNGVQNEIAQNGWNELIKYVCDECARRASNVLGASSCWYFVQTAFKLLLLLCAIVKWRPALGSMLFDAFTNTRRQIWMQLKIACEWSHHFIIVRY